MCLWSIIIALLIACHKTEFVLSSGFICELGLTLTQFVCSIPVASQLWRINAYVGLVFVIWMDVLLCMTGAVSEDYCRACEYGTLKRDIKRDLNFGMDKTQGGALEMSVWDTQF